ncbi:MAG: hypothetical protein CVU88_03955 [Firmicutes bacterium HGW-Firmicutes-13]|nr:MAG: hypothetical protein CVU88_03955 [Firmicutes bacterium HGW-Firmicutes-13]
MNWLDTVFIIILILSFFSGLKKGLVLQLINLFAFIVSWYLAINWGSVVGTQLSTFFNLDTLIDNFGFIHLKEYVIIFLGVITVLFLTGIVFAVLGRMLNFLARIPVIKSFNALFGGAVGLVKGILSIMIITILLYFLPHPFIDQAKEGSFFFTVFSQYTSALINHVVDVLLDGLPQMLVMR